MGILSTLLLCAGCNRTSDISITLPVSGGEYVARAGDCVACHSISGGKAFAGGLEMGTPFGPIYSTNITPDTETGIGSYTLAEFARAVRDGVAKDGYALYPAMPYPSYAKLSDEDVAALYDYFMHQVPAVHRQNVQREIPGLPSLRQALAIWGFMFSPHDRYVADQTHDAAWNRGAYLVEGLGHCGACHTPRGIAFQEKALDEHGTSYLGGTELDGWYAPSLRSEIQTGLGVWSKTDIAEFLRHGHNRIGAVFGSMTEVVNNSTSFMSDRDIDAVATYLKSLPASATQRPVVYDDATTKTLRGGRTNQPGSALYISACGTCHGLDGRAFAPYTPGLAGNPVVLDENSSSLIDVVLNSSTPLLVDGTPGAYRMPQFRKQMTDQDVADVITFIRKGWGNQASAVTSGEVAHLRKTTDGSSDQIIVLRMH